MAARGSTLCETMNTPGLRVAMANSARAVSHGQCSSDRGVFSCLISHWQSHLFNLERTRATVAWFKAKLL
jgi:hypothetical protein